MHYDLLLFDTFSETPCRYISSPTPCCHRSFPVPAARQQARGMVTGEEASPVRGIYYSSGCVSPIFSILLPRAVRSFDVQTSRWAPEVEAEFRDRDLGNRLTMTLQFSGPYTGILRSLVPASSKYNGASHACKCDGSEHSGVNLPMADDGLRMPAARYPVTMVTGRPATPPPPGSQTGSTKIPCVFPRSVIGQ